MHMEDGQYPLDNTASFSAADISTAELNSVKAKKLHVI